jgi:hypothetical protein
LRQSAWPHGILYAGRSWNDGQLLITSFLWKTEKNTNVGGGGCLKLKIHILFYGDNWRTVALRQIKFGTVKHHRHINKCYFNYWYFDEAFKYGDGTNFKDKFGQTMNNSIHNSEILCNVIPL